MAGPQCHMVGAKKLRKELKAAGFNMADLREMNMRIGKLVVGKARPQAPVGPTGRLKKSVKPGATRTRAEAKAGASPRLPYAAAVHWGYPNRTVRPYGNFNASPVPAPIPANPWMVDAVTQTRNQWISMYVYEMNDILDEVRGIPR